jgi:hypothetical protein
MKVVIPSKARADKINRFSLALFPDATVTVDEREVADYAPVVPKGQLLPHPPLQFLPQIRNWLLDHIPDDEFLMVDDDIRSVYSKTGVVIKHYRHPNDVAQIVDNAALVAREIGAHLFGFTQDGGVFGYRPQDPLSFTGWLGTVFGVIGRTWRYDERFLVGTEDMDVSLQCLLNDRIIFIDERFHFWSMDRLRSRGGVGANRSLERELADSELLSRKWGQYVSMGFKATGTRYKSIHVSRRQAKT